MIHFDIVKKVYAADKYDRIKYEQLKAGQKGGIQDVRNRREDAEFIKYKRELIWKLRQHSNPV